MRRRLAAAAGMCAIAVLTAVTLFARLNAAQLYAPELPAVTAAATPTPIPTPSATPTAAPTPTPTPEPEYSGPRNPLTGLPSDSDTSHLRPMAIMLNNRGVAQPQLGISKADIIYETLVEGGITRMLAIYQDISGVGVIGSVRSARHYYLDIAQGHDAVYIHAGGSPQAYNAIAARGIENIDGVNGGRHQIFYRDQDRRKNMGYEHSMVTTSELMQQHLPTYGIRLEHGDNYEYAMKFSDSAAIDGGEPATDITVTFSGAKSTSFSYDESEGAYRVSQYNKAYTDGNDGSQLTVANILVLEADISRISGDSEGRMDIKLSGSGAGCYINGGKATNIKWAKKDAESQFTYALEDGEELVMGRGRIYVCIAPGGALSY